MDNEKLLELIRLERPNQKIHEVISFKENEYGFYDVYVNMEGNFNGVIVRYLNAVLPYPLEKYMSLPEKNKLKYRLNKI